MSRGIFKTNLCKPGLLALFSCIFYVAVSAQAGGIKRYSVNEGLSQSMVNGILQDGQGFLWLCTGGGLSRFDGYQFVAYKHIPGDSGTISSNTIRGAVQDDAGNLYVGTESGLNYFDRIKGRFSKLLFHTSRLNNIAIRPLYYNHGLLLIEARGNGIWQYDTRTKLLKILVPQQISIGDDWIYADDHVILFNCADGRQGMFDRKNQALSFHIQPLGRHPLCYLHYQKNLVLCGTQQGILMLDLQKHSFSNLPVKEISDKRIRSIVRDAYNHYWLAVDGEGLFLYDSHWKLIEIFDNTSYPGLKHIVTLAVDRQNNILAGTEEEGLIIVSYNNLKFKYPSEQLIGQMKSKFVRALYADDRFIYVGTFQRGMYLFEKATNHVRQLMPRPDSRSNEEGNSITAIAPLKNSTKLFIGTGDGAYIYDKAQEKFEPLNFAVPSHPHKNISGCICQGRYECLFYTPYTVYNLVSAGGKYKAVFLHFASAGIRHLFADNSGRLLESHIGMQLHYVDVAKDTELNSNILQDPHGMIEKNYSWVTSFYEEPDGNRMLGTNNGLLEVDANYRLLRQYGLKEGLPDLYIYSIIPANGKLWMSTNKGLTCMDISGRYFTNYDIDDGLKSNEYNSNSYFKDAEGTIYFGGINGFDAFAPAGIQPRPAVSKPVATQFNVFDEPYKLDTSIETKKSISLPWNRNTFSVEISALDLADAGRIKYAFFLEGSDKQWYVSGSRRMVRYTGIAPGEYSLWVKNADAQNSWNKPVLLMHVSILPPFWRTWWFRILMMAVFAALLALAVYFIAARRYRKKLDAMQRQQEIEEVRRRLSRDIHDDIGSDLTKISILTEKIKNRSLANDIEFVGVLDKLSAHTRSVISHLGEIVWTVNPQHDNLSSMLAYFRNFINAFFEDGGIRYRIEFDIPPEEVIVNPELRRNLYLVLKECLNNIVKHACATEVCISFHCKGKAFELVIKDNGEGIRQAAGMSFGNGMQNIRQRSQDSHCTIAIDSEIERGTAIKVSGTIY